jgi:hypothetical protein
LISVHIRISWFGYAPNPNGSSPGSAGEAVEV